MKGHILSTAGWRCSKLLDSSVWDCRVVKVKGGRETHTNAREREREREKERDGGRGVGVARFIQGAYSM